MVRRSNRRRGAARSRRPIQRLVWTGEEIVFQTADTAVNTLVYSNGGVIPQRLSLRNGYVSVTGGNFTTTAWFVIRRVPAGYTAPTAVTVSTSNDTFIDSPDVLAYAVTKIAPDTVESLDWTVIRRTATFYRSDQLIVQAVPTGNSTDLKFSTMLEYTLV